MKLDRLRNALTLAIILAFRMSSKELQRDLLCRDETINALHEKFAKERIEIFDSSQEKFVEEGFKTIGALCEKVDQQNERILDALDNIKAAIKEHSDDQSQNPLRMVAQDIQLVLVRCFRDTMELQDAIPQTRERTMLGWLNFRQMSWRYEEVPEAYRRTCDWIFQPLQEERRWSNFVQYLTDNDVVAPYFISGKAGSGKSTLMKYIIGKRETLDALKKWAGGYQLHIAHFFFWNLGTNIQKSSTGMLRAILHQILRQYPELISASFFELYQNWEAVDVSIEPTYIEMKNALQLLKVKASGFLKLCIFIDGMDEFEGDHKDLAQFLRGLVSPDIKLVVSGRPIPGSINAMHGCPSLKLQDLTRDDMKIYIRGELSSHRLMIELTRLFPQEVSLLTNEIQEKADGVFLWVKLVVRLLVDGLEQGDSIKQLLDKLHVLPPDLRQLYRRMIEQMGQTHQNQAADLFRLYQVWHVTMTGEPFKCALGAFAAEILGLELTPSVELLDLDTLIWSCNILQARLRARCCGLLEVYHINKLCGDCDELKLPNAVDCLAVRYLHRTVAEFLISEDICTEIGKLSHSSGPIFSEPLSMREAILAPCFIMDIPV